MAGRGKVSDADRKPIKRVVMFKKNPVLAPAVEPMHFDKSIAGTGLGRTFGIQIAETFPEVQIGLIPCAVGGSPIRTWVPGGYHSQTKSHPGMMLLLELKQRCSMVRSRGSFGIRGNQTPM